MNGYLQCLIDQYQRKVSKTKTLVEKNIYLDMVNDLIDLKRHIQDIDEEAVIEEDTPKKHIAFDFVGTMPGFMEYLKNLKLKEGK
ncbi:hypothetical protein ACJDU8_22560 [Clostridium sp. WILCCON 0269]|uniref:Uncharacterized protein n=1 Tax=Candidatus Clostridium eludens TaxID=3381663 RepID=A0ABW8SQF7_9CLOT